MVAYQLNIGYVRLECTSVFFKKNEGRWRNMKATYTWRSIEVVITRTTRNRLIGVELVRGFESHLLRQSLETQQFQGFFMPSIRLIIFDLQCTHESAMQD